LKIHKNGKDGKNCMYFPKSPLSGRKPLKIWPSRGDRSPNSPPFGKPLDAELCGSRVRTLSAPSGESELCEDEAPPPVAETLLPAQMRLGTVRNRFVSHDSNCYLVLVSFLCRRSILTGCSSASPSLRSGSLIDMPSSARSSVATDQKELKTAE